MKEVGSFGVVARELRRPLLELRQLALGFDGNGPQDEIVRAEMVSVAERGMRQVDDLMKLGKINDFELGPVAVRAICDEVLSEISEMYKKGLEGTMRMRVKYSNRQRLVRANPELLKSVVFNFLLDATHYTEAGGRAELKVHEVGKKVAVEVRDFGPALPMDVWREVQDNLVKEPRDVAMRPGSSALGLYISSRFSEYMKAEVKAVRHADGTSFIVEMPATRQMSIWGTL